MTNAAHPRSSSNRISSSSSSSSSKTSIQISVYDLLAPGSLSSVLWLFGASLLHTGVVIGDREYAFGGHDRPNLTGVYYTKPHTEPPGATFRTSLLHGFTYMTEDEISETLREVSQEFLGTGYDLLRRNCNHFTERLCEALTGKKPPKWINRAAGVGAAVPCVLPQEWIDVPECEEEEMEALTSGRDREEGDGDGDGDGDGGGDGEEGRKLPICERAEVVVDERDGRVLGEGRRTMR